MTDYTFYRDGGNGTTTIPVINAYLPTVMRQIASTLITGYKPAGEVHAIVSRTQRWLDDTEPKLAAQDINREIEQLLQAKESKAFMIGTGRGEPQGLFLSDAYQRIKRALSSDAIISTIYALNARDRSAASFLCCRRTVYDVKNMKDADGNYLYTPARGVGMPSKFMGLPVFEDENAPYRQLAFGNFPEGYKIASYPDTVIERDPFKQKPNVLFLATRYVDGMPQQPDAVKILEYSNA